MKKLVYSVSIIAALMAIAGADFRPDANVEAPLVIKKKCLGYTIIEFGKGIDCNGDTVKLVKKNGIQTLANVQ